MKKLRINHYKTIFRFKTGFLFLKALLLIIQHENYEGNFPFLLPMNDVFPPVGPTEGPKEDV